MNKSKRFFGDSRITALCALLALMVTGDALAQTGTFRIDRQSGTVKVSVSGKVVATQVGSTLQVPARIETGADGSLRIEQDSSTLDIGPGSVVLLPAASATSEKIIQHLGRVLYSVKPRKTRSFAVETPYLVSVVKGTLFTVAIEDRATAVSLLEGSVELKAEGIPAVLLHPNETARRAAGERTINVTKIDTTPPVPQTGNAVPLPASAASAGNAFLSEATLSDLNQITAARRQAQQPPVILPSPGVPSPVPPVPEAPAPEAPAPEAPAPEAPAPEAPAPEAPAPEAPAPEAPAPEAPAPEVPEVDLTPVLPDAGDDDDEGDDDDDEDDDDCGRRFCDSEHDHDQGGGNNRD